MEYSTTPAYNPANYNPGGNGGAFGAQQGGGIGAPVRSHDDQLKIAHAICMSIGWMAFLSSGILFARFFRSHASARPICGSAIWFHLHRLFNLTGIGLTIAGFVMIFTALGWRWIGPRAFQSKQQNEQWGSIHAMVGLIACVLAWFQPIMASLRCHPHVTGRFIFNWIHRFAGFGAWLCAAAAIMIACVHFETMFRSQKAALGLFIAFVAAFGVTFLVLQLLQFIGWTRSRRQVDSSVDNNSGVRNAQTIFFLLYFIVAIGTCVAICVLIGLKPLA